MIEIITLGTLPEKEWYRIECSKCHTVFQYQPEDVMSNPREGEYVICPLCKLFLEHSNSNRLVHVFRTIQ